MCHGAFAALSKPKLEHKHTNGWMDGRTDGRYQRYYFPGFAVDNHTCRSYILRVTLPWAPYTCYMQIALLIGSKSYNSGM